MCGFKKLMKECFLNRIGVNRVAAVVGSAEGERLLRTRCRVEDAEALEGVTDERPLTVVRGTWGRGEQIGSFRRVVDVAIAHLEVVVAQVCGCARQEWTCEIILHRDHCVTISHHVGRCRNEVDKAFCVSLHISGVGRHRSALCEVVSGERV